MKVLQCVLLAALLAFHSSGAFAQRRSPLHLFSEPAPRLFETVPKDDWTLQAITKLQSYGIVSAYPSDYFTGRRELTRYEVALALARAAERMESVGRRPDDEALGLVQYLTYLYRDEIGALGNPAAAPSKIGSFDAVRGTITLGHSNDRLRTHRFALGSPHAILGFGEMPPTDDLRRCGIGRYPYTNQPLRASSGP